MTTSAWLQRVTRSVADAGRRPHGRPARRLRSIGLYPELLEDRSLLSGMLPPGSPDPSFGQDGVVTTSFNGGNGSCIGALQPDGKIVVVGEVETTGGQSTLALLRYLPNGQLDTSFGPNQIGETVVDPTLNLEAAAAVAIVSDPGQRDDGDIVVTGSWYDSATQSFVSALARFQPDGSPDPSFGGTGVILETQANSNVAISGPVLIQSGGKILVGGETSLGTHGPGNTVAAVERFNEDGTLDSTFAPPILNGSLFGGLSSGIRGLAFDASGNIIAMGNEESAQQTQVIALAA